ncbi:MAG: LysR family transcriptional regulator [Burkholderiales bacterium]|nr:LysR family transcriptional regulator [Burkholderiales bacterium]
MRRKLPSTGALEAFEAAARHQSFTKAAEELSVTQSAVCRQVAALESFLDVRLFRRTRRGVMLTEAGLDYSRSVGARLDEVERDTLELMARGGRGSSLELAVVPTFGTRWLLPRLPAFQRAHPHVAVHLSSRTRPFLFADTPFDAAIHAGETGSAAWPGTEKRFLMSESLIAVASPALPALAAGRPQSGADWARLPLLQQSTRPYAWRQFFDGLGLAVPQPMAGPRLELFSMLTEAAVHGMGVALAPPFFVQEELAQGRLVDIAPRPVSGQRAYSLIWPEEKAELPALRAFADWLQAEAAG